MIERVYYRVEIKGRLGKYVLDVLWMLDMMFESVFLFLKKKEFFKNDIFLVKRLFLFLKKEEFFGKDIF